MAAQKIVNKHTHAFKWEESRGRNKNTCNLNNINNINANEMKI